jgi:ribonuclease T2
LELLSWVNFRFVLNGSCQWGEDMIGHRIREAAHTAAIATSFIFLFAIVALAQDRQTQGSFAQDRRQNTPGQFDFYVLALSWSPSFCEASQERAPNRAPDQQCSGRPFAFVVHGLWPQYEQGFPAFCQVPAPRLDRTIVGGMLDLMPSPRLIFHEWDRHGTCSGFSAHGYFETVRKARALVKIPADYLELDKPIMVTPDEVAEAFVKANPGLSRASVAVACDSKRLSEIRVCLGKDFAFHECAEVTRRACRRDKIAMPAVRGG